VHVVSPQQWSLLYIGSLVMWSCLGCGLNFLSKQSLPLTAFFLLTLHGVYLCRTSPFDFAKSMQALSSDPYSRVCMRPWCVTDWSYRLLTGSSASAPVLNRTENWHRGCLVCPVKV
jgi:hypothetical protein